MPCAAPTRIRIRHVLYPSACGENIKKCRNENYTRVKVDETKTQKIVHVYTKALSIRRHRRRSRKKRSRL